MADKADLDGSAIDLDETQGIVDNDRSPYVPTDIENSASLRLSLSQNPLESLDHNVGSGIRKRICAFIRGAASAFQQKPLEGVPNVVGVHAKRA